ncbi:MAG: ADP-forming succinate--CoA ligase subunit beta [Pseudomonadota bacterium]|jgi:succinyl-CoA synthetase beta subunit
MNLHEYQAKELFRRYGVPVPAGQVAATPAAAVKAAKALGGSIWVVKAQVHAGGRGKAGGVKVCKTLDEVAAATTALIGQRLVTKQTGPEGLPIHQVYVEVGSKIERELYLSLLLNRDRSRLAFVASADGGMDIEEVAEHTPERILKVELHPSVGVSGYQCRELAFGLGLAGTQVAAFEKVMRGMLALYLAHDAALIEINPLIVTADGDVLALDGKINIDPNAVYRQPEIAKYRDTTQEDAREVEASKYDLNYVSLDGDIACMVNGAGLAMATMDLIKLHGGHPANFLDVGGGATKERVTAAFQLILSNPNVRAILVNIFGGIVRCDIIAEGIVAAVKTVGVQIPVIVRLEGTNAELARAQLAASGLAITAASDLTDAATKAVRLAAGR